MDGKTVFRLILRNIFIILIFGGILYLIITSPFDLKLLIIPYLILLLPVWFIANYSLIHELSDKQKTMNRIIIVIAVIISIVALVILGIEIVKSETDEAMDYIEKCEPPENYMENFKNKKSVSSFNAVINWCCENYSASYKLCKNKNSRRA